MTQGLIPGSELVARCDFQGTSPKHLKLSKGDILTVIDNVSNETSGTDEWVLAENINCEKGLVPLSHLQRRTEVKINSMPWFHGKITREEAERLLQPPKVSTVSRLFILYYIHPISEIVKG